MMIQLFIFLGGASIHSEGELGQSGREFGGVLIIGSDSRGQARLPRGGEVNMAYHWLTSPITTSLLPHPHFFFFLLNRPPPLETDSPEAAGLWFPRPECAWVCYKGAGCFTRWETWGCPPSTYPGVAEMKNTGIEWGKQGQCFLPPFGFSVPSHPSLTQKLLFCPSPFARM